MFLGVNTTARRARRPGAASGPGAGRPQARTVALVAAAAVGGGLVTLGGIAWTTPRTVAVTHPIQVKQRAGMTYDAQALRSAAYPTGQVRTGDPVFLRLVPTMDVAIAYRAELVGKPLDSTGLSGTRRVTAELRSTNGWHRGFELLPRTDFTGGGFNAVAPIDLKHVRALVTGVKKVTGVDGGTFTLSVRSEIALTGMIPGRSTGTAVRGSFFPELTFAYDGKQLQLVGERSGPVPAGPITEVVRSRSSAVQVPASEPNQLSLLGRGLPVEPVRTGGLAAGLALLMAAGWAERSRRIARQTPPDRIVRRIVLDDETSPPPVRTTIATRPSASTRTRVPGPRTAALAERQWARTHPGPRDQS